MIIILTRADLKQSDQHITEIDIRVATELLGHECVARAGRIEFHDYNGWIRVIKDRELLRPPGYLPKTRQNGFGEADRINHVGYHKSDWYATVRRPETDTKDMKAVGFNEKYQPVGRKLILDGPEPQPKPKKKNEKQQAV